MDNLPAHQAKSVEQFLQSRNIAYLFTPPYSPEFNPIEEAFSITKHMVRQEKPRIFKPDSQSTMDFAGVCLTHNCY